MLALAHAHFVPVINHVWGSAVAVAVNAHLLTAMPDLPGGLNPWSPMLEFDTTPNLFRDEMPTEPLNIVEQIGQNDGTMAVPERPGIGVEPDAAFLKRYAVT